MAGSLANTGDNPAELQPWSLMLAVTHTSPDPITPDGGLLAPYPTGSVSAQDVKLEVLSVGSIVNG